MTTPPELLLKSFFRESKPLPYKKGEILLRGDEAPQGIFFLDKGFVKNYFVSENGDEFTFIIYKKNDFFPIAWTFNETRKPYFFEATMPSIVYRRSREEFLGFLKENPEVFFFITAKITRRMDGLLERMEHMAFGNAYKRLCSILYILSERFGRTLRNELIIEVPLTHRDIANLLGVARETVSIEITKLKREGVIRNAGQQIHILDVKRLKEESQIY